MAKKQSSPKPKPNPKKPAPPQLPSSYTHPGPQVAMRPDIGTQDKFRKKKAPVTYRYDSSLSPALDWDGQNGARELGEWLLARITEAAALPAPHRFPTPQQFTGASGAVLATVHSLQDAVEHLKRLGAPFLTWTGKAERLSFDVPTMPLFVHERLSTQAIVETLIGHKKDKQQSLFDLFGDPQHSIADQVMRAYEHQDQWVNRMILGDSLVVMNSLLQYEGLGGQVQMIYIDPPYGVKFGSNFQPFVRKRDVSHNDDEDLTREPEMVKAYRDTWELGLHSYLTYMRDRLLMARELLTPGGSVFVQISDENLHHVRELMDEVFGPGCFCGQIAFKTTSSQTDDLIASVTDFVLWYCRDREKVRYRQLFRPREAGSEGMYEWVEDVDGTLERLGDRDFSELPEKSRVFARDNLTSARPPGSFPFPHEGRELLPGRGFWKTHLQGLTRLAELGRIVSAGERVYYKRYFHDFPYVALNSVWSDTQSGGTYVESGQCEAPAHALFPQIARIVQHYFDTKVVPVAPAEKVDAYLSPYYGWAIERISAAIRPDAAAGEAPEVPVFESSRGPGSTADVDYWTSKDVREVLKSHLNYVVADTKVWEQSAAFILDTHPKVSAFVKNAGLGFAIPYLHNGQPHDYLPDFIVRSASNTTTHVIIETKGFDPLAEVKAAAAQRWVAAVNADGQYGTWRYEMARSVGAVREILDAC